MQRHLVFTNGRSGSNYLAGLINRHPQLVNYGEVLGEWTIPYRIYEKLMINKLSMADYLNYLYSSRSFFYLSQIYSAFAHLQKSKKVNLKRWRAIQSLGIKDFSMNFTRRGLRNYLREQPDIKVICLYRENHLERYISYLNLQQSGVVSLEKGSSEGNSPPNFKVNVPIDILIRELETIERETLEQLEIVRELSPERVYKIRYEDLFSSAEKRILIQSEMFDFLEVETLDIQGSSRKILSKQMADIIENYDDFYQALKQTKYEKFLNH